MSDREAEIALQLDKSIGTVRVQIKSILSKTGTGSQKALISLMKNLAINSRE